MVFGVDHFIFSIMMVYLVYSIVFETVFVCFLNSASGINQSPCFYTGKILHGGLRRLTIIIQSIMSAIFMDGENRFRRIDSMQLLLTLVMSQLLSIYMVFKSMKKVRKEILQSTGRNQRITRATGYDALSAALYRVSIKPNENMVR